MTYVLQGKSLLVCIIHKLQDLIKNMHALNFVSLLRSGLKPLSQADSILNWTRTNPCTIIWEYSLNLRFKSIDNMFKEYFFTVNLPSKKMAEKWRQQSTVQTWTQFSPSPFSPHPKGPLRNRCSSGMVGSPYITCPKSKAMLGPNMACKGWSCPCTSRIRVG